MSTFHKKERILILGASGFIGYMIYKELCVYFNTFGTYNTPRKKFEKNTHFLQYKVEEDDIIALINTVKPSIIISAIRGNFSAQILAHRHLCEYIIKHPCKLIFLSSANAFDAYSNYPSYEYDKTLSQSIYGHFKIQIENMLLRLPPKNIAILRIPMVFGAQSPRVNAIKTLSQNNEAIEIYPNLIMNVTNATKLTQQIHYIINRKKYGIYHLGSKDLVYHEDFIKDIVRLLNIKAPLYKMIHTTDNDRYLAILPKEKQLPKHLQITSEIVLEDITNKTDTLKRNT
ncbi:MAG: sugar nucleotide-binding protein [Flavobacteriaceae bacterium]|nr:sugar nucleotide-binding protein [Flavobacteriaceae bacterium]